MDESELPRQISGVLTQTLPTPPESPRALSQPPSDSAYFSQPVANRSAQPRPLPPTRQVLRKPLNEPLPFLGTRLGAANRIRLPESQSLPSLNASRRRAPPIGNPGPIPTCAHLITKQPSPRRPQPRTQPQQILVANHPAAPHWPAPVVECPKGADTVPNSESRHQGTWASVR